MLSVHGLSRPGLGPIDLDLPSGVTALSGPSGAGKSMLLRAIADLDPNEGRLTLDGEDRDHVAAPEWRRRVAYVAAESGWWEDIVAGHFADAGLARRMLAALNLADDALEWPVARLSTGERQRLALLRVLVQDPRVMLLDEPTSALDADSAAAVEAVIAERCRAGVAVLIVSHDGAQAERLGARRLRMAGGRLAEAAP